MSYRKTGTEVCRHDSTHSLTLVSRADNQWEILGDLALRLQHKEEAKDAFQRCLDSKFSAKALLKLLEMYSAEGDLQRTLNIAIRLTTYHHRYVLLPSCSSRCSSLIQMRLIICPFIVYCLNWNGADGQMVHGRFLSFHGRSLFVQTGFGTRSRQNPIHTAQHGA